MATKEKNEYLKNGVLYRNDLRVGDDGMNHQERSNKKLHSPGAAVGVDGLTAVQRGRALQKAKKEKRAYPLQLLKKEFKLGKGRGGTAWTHQAVAAYMAREMDFIVTGVYKNNRTPLEGFCLICGESTPEGKGPRWNDVTEGKSSCNSSACGGNQMPPEQFMEAAFKERGVELVGAYPTGKDRKFWLRHIGGEGACQQKYKTTWKGFYTLKYGCAVCSGQQIAVGYNDLATVKPELAAEMVFPDPTTVTAGSDTKANWKCGDCNYEWSAKVTKRSSGNGCPECSTSGYKLTAPAGSIYASHKASAENRPRRFFAKVGITNQYVPKRIQQHKNTGLIMPAESVTSLTHWHPELAYVLEKYIFKVMDEAEAMLDDVELTVRGDVLKPKEVFVSRNKLIDGEKLQTIYDDLIWCQLNTEEEELSLLGIADENSVCNCAVEFFDHLMVYEEH